jgi:hypothetical protein
MEVECCKERELPVRQWDSSVEHLFIEKHEILLSLFVCIFPERYIVLRCERFGCEDGACSVR